MVVKDLLESCSGSYHTLEGDHSVEQALKLMSAHCVSALVVMDRVGSRGIFTEHDLVRCHLLFPGRKIQAIQVKEVMTKKLIVAEPEDTIDDAMGYFYSVFFGHIQKGLIFLYQNFFAIHLNFNHGLHPGGLKYNL